MGLIALYLLLLRATVLSFSGFASVPLIREDLVIARGVLDDQQLNAAIAISQASPGPLGLYIVAVGYFVGGIPGAFCALLAVCTPAALVLAVARLFRVGRDEWVRRTSSAVVLISSMLVLTAASQMFHQATPSAATLVIGVAGFLAIAFTRVPPVVVVATGAMIASLL